MGELTIGLFTCSDCGKPMQDEDLKPAYGRRAPTICKGCRTRLARDVFAAKQAFYGEER